MDTKLLSPKAHAVIDYALVCGLFVLPAVFDFNKSVKKIYAVEALVLLPYIALTKQPLAAKGLIPFRTHGKIDPFNVAQFAIQSFFDPFRRTKKELVFNVAFTAIAGLTVIFTRWNEK